MHEKGSGGGQEEVELIGKQPQYDHVILKSGKDLAEVELVEYISCTDHVWVEMFK